MSIEDVLRDEIARMTPAMDAVVPAILGRRRGWLARALEFLNFVAV